MDPLTLNRVRYHWADGWHDERYQVPPTATVQELNRLAEPELMQEDERVTDAQLLLERAKVARDWEQANRAIRLAFRAFATGRTHHGAAAVLSSVLRHFRSREHTLAAIEATNDLRDSSYPPLLTTRAAACCDACEYALSDGNESLAADYLRLAEQSLRRAFAIDGRAGRAPTEQFLVRRRWNELEDRLKELAAVVQR